METVGVSFAADLLKSNSQSVLLLSETVNSFTTACIIDNENAWDTPRCSFMCGTTPLDGPPAVISLDPAHGIFALNNDDVLKELGIYNEIG